MKIFTFEASDRAISPAWANHTVNILSKAAVTKIEILPAPEELQKLLNAWDGRQDLIEVVVDYFGNTSDIRLLVSAANDLRYKEYCKRVLGHAEWGCCLSGFIAVDYAPTASRLPTQIHETLHLFGVDECYNENTLNPRPSCNRSDCLMRYGVHSTEVCDHVLSQLRKN